MTRQAPTSVTTPTHVFTVPGRRVDGAPVVASARAAAPSQKGCRMLLLQLLLLLHCRTCERGRRRRSARHRPKKQGSNQREEERVVHHGGVVVIGSFLLLSGGALQVVRRGGGDNDAGGLVDHLVHDADGLRPPYRGLSGRVISYRSFPSALPAPPKNLCVFIPGRREPTPTPQGATNGRCEECIGNHPDSTGTADKDWQAAADAWTGDGGVPNFPLNRRLSIDRNDRQRLGGITYPWGRYGEAYVEGRGLQDAHGSRCCLNFSGKSSHPSPLLATVGTHTVSD